MTALEFAACVLILAAAAWTQGVFGLGFAMIATPLLALFLDYPTAVVCAAVPLWVLSSGWLIRHRARIRSAAVPWPLVPGIVLGSATGVALQATLSAAQSLTLLAALLVTSVVLPRWFQVRAQHAGTSHTGAGLAPRLALPAAAAMLGAMAGVTESALNVGAPFIVLLAGLYLFTRQQMQLALNLCFCVGKSIQLGLLWAMGQLHAPPAVLVVGVFVCLIAYRWGDGWAGRFAEDRFKRALQLFLLVMAATLLVRAGWA